MKMKFENRMSGLDNPNFINSMNLFGNNNNVKNLNQNEKKFILK